MRYHNQHRPTNIEPIVPDRWDTYFLNMALESARMSKDPSTKVGACLVGKSRSVIATGFNGFPRGIADSPERLNDREKKLAIVVHAEMNAVLMAARLGISTDGATIYVAATDASKEIWGGPPCVRCAVECMQAGIVEYVSWPGHPKLMARWMDSIKQARSLIVEAGLKYREVPRIIKKSSSTKWCKEPGEAGPETCEYMGRMGRRCPSCKN